MIVLEKSGYVKPFWCFTSYRRRADLKYAPAMIYGGVANELAIQVPVKNKVEIFSNEICRRGIRMDILEWT